MPTQQLTNEQLVLNDLRIVREALRERSGDRAAMFQTSVELAALHILIDGLCIVLAVWAFRVWGNWCLPASLLVIGNRQRALGNVLHDLGHRNVSRRPRLNDFIAVGLVAPLLFADFQRYRSTHLAHHTHLGNPECDPDFMPSAGTTQHAWRTTYGKRLFNLRVWLHTSFGDFARPIGLPKWMYMALWWCVLLVGAGLAIDWRTSGIFVTLWLGARATFFVAITQFREMCDHFGRTSGGIFSFSRDITAPGLLRHLIHPHNNGYHLTHHLLPTVPYYRLDMAHTLLSQLSVYRDKAKLCGSYFFGTDAVIHV